MRTVSVDSIKDFQVCELFYNYRYEEKLPETFLSRDLMHEKFENTLKRVVSFFFYKKQANVTPSYNALLNRWEKLWFPKDMTAYDIAVEKHENQIHGNLVNYSNHAAASLMKFHEDFTDEERTPILIDEKFLIPLPDHMRLEGCFDLVLRDKDDQHTIIKWSAKNKVNIANYKFDFAAQKIAFDYRNNRLKSVNFALYDLASTNPGAKDFIPTPNDINAFAFWANKLATTEIFVPRRGFTSYCKNCPFDASCSKWNGWTDGNG